MHRPGIPVLGILNQEYHQKCNDRRSRIDDELPGIAKTKERTCNQPEYHDPSCQSECDRMSGGTSPPFLQNQKTMTTSCS
jgi:hypothetical protein